MCAAVVKARSRLTAKSTVAPAPSCASASATESSGRQSTLCLGSWSSPGCASVASAPDAERMVPPSSASEFSSTAIPCVDQLGSTTVWAKTSSVVPEPLSYAARFSPHGAGSMSIESAGVPPDVSTVTGASKVTATRIMSPSR